MSGPVPSPSMKGRMGSLGTLSLPEDIVMGEGMGGSKSRKSERGSRNGGKSRLLAAGGKDRAGRGDLWGDGVQRECNAGGREFGSVVESAGKKG